MERRYAVQMYEANLSGPLPVELAHGQEAKWFVPLAGREEPWLTYFARDMLMPNTHVSCATLRAQFFTSLGHVFVAKPERHLVAKFRAACAEVKGNGG
jgi:hypothetical protein